jgi:hypothetical protein
VGCPILVSIGKLKIRNAIVVRTAIGLENGVRNTGNGHGPLLGTPQERSYIITYFNVTL